LLTTAVRRNRLLLTLLDPAIALRRLGWESSRCREGRWLWYDTPRASVWTFCETFSVARSSKQVKCSPSYSPPLTKHNSFLE
jgi:hypothetical protein